MKNYFNPQGLPFSMIPHIIDDLGLSVYAYRLYGRILRRAGVLENGICFESTENLAAACKMSTGMVSKAKKELVKEGLITIEKRKQSSDGGYGYIQHYITVCPVLIPDEKFMK